MGAAVAHDTAPAATSMIEARDVGVTFDNGTRALDAIDLRVAKGEIVALVGPSGCGKSTMLRVVAGLLAANDGEVSVDGMAPDEARRTTTESSLVFQAPTLLPWRTVRRNVALPLELRGATESGSERRARIDAVLTMVGLADFADAYPHELSGGMQMRVSLARALVTNPKLLLLDEPFGALDDITRQTLNEELLALRARDAWTALFVTHNVSEAVFLSDRVLVMSRRPGRIVAEVNVPFAHPREADLRGDAEFARLANEVSRHLRSAHA